MYQLSLKHFKSVGIDCHLVLDTFLVPQFYIHEAIDIFHRTQKKNDLQFGKRSTLLYTTKNIYKKN